MNYVNIGHLLSSAEKGDLAACKIRWFAWLILLGIIENTSVESIKKSLKASRKKYEELKEKYMKKENHVAQTKDDPLYDNPLMRGNTVSHP